MLGNGGKNKAFMKFTKLTLLQLIYNLGVVIFDIVRLIIEGVSFVPVFCIVTYSILEFVMIAVLIKDNKARFGKKRNYRKDNDANKTFVSKTIINEDIIAKNSTTNIVNNNYSVTSTYSVTNTTFTKKEN